ncbi:MAG: transposon-transfer assisting family protein [Lachnospiraceae bacterium]|nr:transposon-transfer assisting family protein [Lachnospiraceae bacterium]
MENKFTVEEINLISIFTEEDVALDLESRAKVIKGISDAMKHLEDDEMVELSLRVIVKLNDLTDQEFAEMEFAAAE